MQSKKILAVFGNVANAGQERANCDVFALIANETPHKLRVLVNDRGFHWHLQPFFERNNIPFKKIRFPWGIYAHSRLSHILQWGVDILRNNFQFVREYFRFRPDYIHIGNEYMFKTLILPLMLCRATIVFRLGDRPFLKHAINPLFWRLISRRVDTFVCDTNFNRGLLAETGRGQRKSDVVLYHPAPIRHVDHPEQFEKTPGTTIFGYIGQIKESKGVKMIVEAAREILQTNPNVEFWFAGDCDNDFYKNQIHPLLATMPEAIARRIKFIGKIEDVNSYYKTIDVHMAPTLGEEPYGLVVVEAKSNHTPSIIFRSGGMLELVDSQINGLIVNEKDKTHLKEAIEYYIVNPDAIATHGRRAYESLSEKGISYENFKSTWTRIYQ